MYISVNDAIAALKNQKLVAFPTETVYGLGAIATFEKAVEEIYRVKQRPQDNPLICHFFDIEQIKQYVLEIDEISRALLEHITPGPLSIMFPIEKNSPLKAATRGSDFVLCRIPDHPIALSILSGTQLPIAAPSANKSGRLSPTTAHMVDAELGSEIAGVVDGGPCGVGLESTIVRVKDSVIEILRPGAIGAREIDEVLTKTKISATISYAYSTKEVTPGSKYRHYAPKTQLVLVDSPDQIQNQSTGVLIGSSEAISAFQAQGAQSMQVKSLGSKTVISDLAKNLYALLYDLDQQGDISIMYLIEESYGESGLAHALENRINKMIA